MWRSDHLLWISQIISSKKNDPVASTTNKSIVTCIEMFEIRESASKNVTSVLDLWARCQGRFFDHWNLKTAPEVDNDRILHVPCYVPVFEEPRFVSIILSTKIMFKSVCSSPKITDTVLTDYAADLPDLAPWRPIPRSHIGKPKLEAARVANRFNFTSEMQWNKEFLHNKKQLYNLYKSI